MNTHKVIWQEGMLLRPQHFQHNDRYYDHQMKTRTQLLGGYTWVSSIWRSTCSSSTWANW